MAKMIEIPAYIRAKLNAAPEFTHEEVGVRPGRTIARGFAEVQELINRGGRPRAEDPRVNVSIRIPKSYAARLRKTGPGWQTRMGDFLITGVDHGDKRLIPA
ncbi:MAG: BrnA antitoxin family protein [Rickettsiales bacterium]|jgi:uncharacterized protein (DUF4415 family)|nr:BrnA antitoxin family protein [Rickettsiales bacterium]